MSIKAIFYDFDGVIKDSTHIKSLAFYQLYLPFGEAIANKVVEHHQAHGGMSRFEKFKLYHRQFLNINLTTEELNKWANRFSEQVLQNVINSPFIEGALESIKEGSKRYQQFIVTGTPQNEIEFIVKQTNISSYFVAVCGSPEKKISIAERLLYQYNLNPHNVLFVGDSVTDYECAKHFGFNFYLRAHPENETFFKSIDVFKSNDLRALLPYAQEL